MADSSNVNVDMGKGHLLKRKDFLGLDEEAAIHPNRTYYYRKHFDADEIVNTCSKKLQLEPNNVGALFLRGSAYLKKRLYDVCIADFNLVLLSDPCHTECLYSRGLAHSKIGLQDIAISDFSKVLDMNPDHVNAAFARAACYNTIGQFSRAIEDYNIALLKDQGPSKIDSRTDLRRRSSNEPLGRKNVDAANISSRGFNEFNGVDLEMMSKTRSQFSGFELEKISSQPFPLCKDAIRNADMRPRRAPPSVPSMLASQMDGDFAPVLIPSPPKMFKQSQMQSNFGNSFHVSAAADTEEQTAHNVHKAEQYHALGYKLRKEGNFEGAIVQYSAAISAYPRHFKALFNRGFALDKVGKYEEAIADYSRALEVDPKNAFAFYNRGISLDRMKRFDAAYEDFSVAISLQPGNADFHHNRAYCLRQMERMEEAVTDYTIALQILPNHFKSLNNRAFCYERLGLLSAAVEDYSSALAVQPGHHSTLVNRAVVLDRLERFEDAIADLTNALRVDGVEISFTLGTRGKIFSKMGLIDEALADFDQALGVDIKDASLLLSRGTCYKSAERYVDAIADFTKALELEVSVAAFTHRGFCWRKLDEYEKSIDDYSHAIQLAPDSVRAHNNRAYSFAKMGKFEEAIRDYSKVIDLDKTNSHAYHNRGISFDKLGLVDEAIADFTKVLELDAASPEEILDFNDRGNYKELIPKFEACRPGNKLSIPNFENFNDADWMLQRSEDRVMERPGDSPFPPNNSKACLAMLKNFQRVVRSSIQCMVTNLLKWSNQNQSLVAQ